MKKYTEPVTFTVRGEKLKWIPRYVEGTGLLAAETDNGRRYAFMLYQLVQYRDEIGVIAATPEGPFLPATLEDLYTTVWALNELFYGEISVLGDAPTLRDMGLDMASNFDEYDNPIIR